MLAEVTGELRKRKLLDKIEVFVDGGVRRGTDVFKCLALGARAVPRIEGPASVAS